MKLHAGGVWFISDENERDISILSKKYPNIPLNYIVNVTPREKIFLRHWLSSPQS
jgi:hypothetical protein